MSASTRRAIGAAFIAHITAFGVLAAFSSLVRPVAASASVGRGAAALATSLPVALLLGLSRRAGRLADAKGSQPLILGGGAVAAIALAGSALAAQSLTGLLLCGVGIGVGMSGLFVPSLSLVEDAVDAPRRAPSIGIAATGSAIGSLLIPPIAWLLVSQNGLAAALTLLSVVTLVGALGSVACAGARTLRAGAPMPSVVDGSAANSLLRLRLVAIAASPAYYIPLAHLGAAAHDASLSVPLVLMAVGASNAAGRLTAASLYRRLGVLALGLGCVGLALSSAMLMAGRTGALVAGAAVVYGFGSGVFVVLLPTRALETSPRDPGDVIGAVYSTMAVGALLAPVIAGAAFDRAADYAAAVAVAGVLALVSAALIERGTTLQHPS